MLTEKKKAINRNHSWLLLESLILPATKLWYDFIIIRELLSKKDFCLPDTVTLLVTVCRNLAKESWQDCRDHVAATRPCPGFPDVIWESPGGGKVEIHCSCWQKWCRYFLPVLPPCQLEAESMSYGGCFPHPSAAHITASLELERSQRLMRIPFSWMNPQDEGSSYWLWTPLNSVSGHLLKCFKVTGLLGFWANRLLHKDLPKPTDKQTKAKSGREPRGEEGLLTLTEGQTLCQVLSGPDVITSP